MKFLICCNEPKNTVTSPMKHKAKLTHFLNFFLARWCASSPSDNVFRDCSGTWVRARSPPNQRTQTLSPSVTGPTSFPGHAGNPRAAPQTRSPSERPPDPSSAMLSVCATTVVHSQDSLLPRLESEQASWDSCSEWVYGERERNSVGQLFLITVYFTYSQSSRDFKQTANKEQKPIYLQIFSSLPSAMYL